MLLLSIALLIALEVTTALIIYGLYENCKGFLAPHWAASLVLAIILTDFFKVLLLEQISDSTTTLRENLGVQIVRKVRL